MIDTLTHVIHDTVYVHSADAMDIINTTNSFYDSAWTRLITYSTVLIAFFGIIAPLLSFLYQRRLIKLDKKELSNRINTHLNSFDIKINVIDNRAKGAIHALNGSLALSQGDVGFGFINFLQAARYYVMCEEYINTNNVLDSAYSILKTAKAEDIENARKVIALSDISIEQYINEIIKEDKKSVVTTKLKALRDMNRDLIIKKQNA